MPNIITHTIFMDEVLDSLDEDLKEWMEPRKQLMEIGSNGPDFLFFHGFSPERILKKTPIRKLGNTAHHQKVNDFYIKAVECIQKEKDEDIQKDMMAYVCGHLCHWAMDCTVHPYVFYRTGTCRGESAWWHHRFESILDALVLYEKRGCTIEEYRAGAICSVDLEMARAIARVYVPIAHDVFGVDMKPHQVLESLNDWEFMQGVFYDPTGSKRTTFNAIEKVLGKESLISGYFVPNTLEDPYDVCNLNHDTWYHPCDNTIVSTDSFYDLYDKAKVEAMNAIRLFLKAIESEQGKIDLVYFLKDRNYDMGMAEDLEMKYFNLIW